MIVMTCKIDGNHRYNWINNQRSLFVSRTGPCILRRKTFCLKPTPRFEWRGQDGQNETQQRNHCALTLGDPFG
jgi:hypothetical protein